MLLSARMLDSVATVNIFEQVTQVKMFVGDAPAIYFMLIDLNQDRSDHGFNPSGRRYVPSAAATLSVVLDNLDDARKVTRAATQPFTDLSIWKVQLTTADLVKGTVNLKLTLTETSGITRGYVSGALRVENGSELDSSIGWTGGTIP